MVSVIDIDIHVCDSVSAEEWPTVVRYHKNGICDEDEFVRALTTGVPLCVEGADENLQGEWEPRAFKDNYGALEVSPIDCLTDEVVAGIWTVGDFYWILESGDTSRGPLKLKVSVMFVSEA